MSSFFVVCDKRCKNYDKIEYLVFFHGKKIQDIVKKDRITIDKKWRIW